MKYFIYIPGMPFDGDTIKRGQSLGGSESAGYYLALGLAKLGHSVFVFCNTPDGKPKKIDDVNYINIGAPNQAAPYGIDFMRHADSMPHDVLIAQRSPGIFTHNYNSKINLWWSHDLALKRYAVPINQMLWNVNRFLSVSEFHKKQINAVYGVEEQFIDVLPNGVDLALYQEPINIDRKLKSKTMIYSHRPERGLINLVKAGGIMEKLWAFDREIRLLVCSYQNPGQGLESLYNELYQRCAILPNVQNIGFLSKKDLAVVQSNSWLHVYPTEFEETSCITMMEQSAAGTPIIATEVGALPETLKDGGVVWANLENFVNKVKNLSRNNEHWIGLHKKALKKATEYSTDAVTENFDRYVTGIFDELTRDKKRLFHHFIYNSDVVAASKVMPQHPLLKDYDFMVDDPTENAGRYEEVADYNESINNKHSLGNYAVMLSIPRMAPVREVLAELKPGARILDFGCCVGQITFAMQSAYPQFTFDGCDISKKQIDVANEHKKTDKRFAEMMFTVISDPSQVSRQYDAVFCMEVLEHIKDQTAFMAGLEKLVKPGGKLLFTTPVGVTDSVSPERNKDGGLHVKSHLHHFEEMDIVDMVGHKTGFEIFFAKERADAEGEKRGAFVWWYTIDKPGDIRPIDYKRKTLIQAPRQRVTACIICRNDGDTLARTLKSVAPFVDDFVVGIDGPYKGGNAYGVARKFNSTIFPVTSPIKGGFDNARNETLEHAKNDWIIWLDDDEDFKWPNRIKKYFRENPFDAYAIHHLHFTVDPTPSLMKDDLPARVFRNNRGIRFFGVVHEHPEKSLNDGPGNSFLIPHHDGCIAHGGYDTEETRRSRFVRNWPLMCRDREKYPYRRLGRFLWIRDLAHVNRFKFEETGVVTDEMRGFAKQAIGDWRKMLDEGETRFVSDSLPYLSESVHLLTGGGGFHFRYSLDLNFAGLGDNLNGNSPGFIEGRLETREDLLKLTALLTDDKAKPLHDGQKYI